ncbi:hypothetical protein Q7P37_005509 [Cladosporium fusiforme]
MSQFHTLTVQDPNTEASVELEALPAGGRQGPIAQADHGSSSSGIELIDITTACKQPGNGSALTHELSNPPSRMGADVTAAASLLPDERRASRIPNAMNKPSRFKELVLDTWICESIAMTFSVACLTAVAIIVLRFDNQTIPHFVSGITLNTIISILSTAARMALIYVVSATLGQLKWHWFDRKGRQLRDMQVLDDASRGPVGSFAMLFSSTRSSLAMLGGIITVMMIASGPFLQQVLDYPSRVAQAANGEARISRNSNYTYIQSIFVSQNEEPVYGFYDKSEAGELKYAIKSGLYSDLDSFAPDPTCSTSTCLWDNHKSVGWCTSCEDATSVATLDDCDINGYLRNASAYLREASPRLPNCTIDLGKGDTLRMLTSPRHLGGIHEGDIAVDLAREAIWPVSFGVPWEPSFHLPPYQPNATYMGTQNPLAVFGYASLELRVDQRLPIETSIRAASQCFITLCEREYEVRVENGITNSTVVSTNYGHVYHRYGNACWKPEAKFVAFYPDEPALDTETGAFCPVNLYGYLISEILRTNATEPIVSSWDDSANTYYLSGIDDYEYADTRSPDDIVGPMATKDLKTMIEGVAASLTNYGLQKSNLTVVGRTFTNETFVHVRWYWFILPASLQIASLILFLATIVQSRRAGLPVWKSSALALLHHDRSFNTASESLERLSEMDKAASTTTAQLVANENGGLYMMRRASNGIRASAEQ